MAGILWEVPVLAGAHMRADRVGDCGGGALAHAAGGGEDAEEDDFERFEEY